MAAVIIAFLRCAARFGAAAAVVLLFVGSIAASAAGVERGSVTYTAKVFMKGMRVTVPSGWKVYEDHPGEFNVQAPAGAMRGTHIHFWLDPYAGGPNGVVLRRVARTPDGLLAWLRHNRYFVVSAPRAARIGGGLAARYVDVDLRPNAPAEDPSCGMPCQTWFVFKGPGYDFPFGTGLGELTRVYFAAVGRGSTTHTFVIAIDAPSHKVFAAVAPIATTIVAHVRLPAKVCASRC